MVNSLEMYLRLFKLLTVKVTNGVKAPHKALMLLTIFDLIESGYIKSNEIFLDDNIAKVFKEKWNKLIASQERFKFFSPNPWTPFWHLKNDHFWRFVPNKGFCSDDIDKISSGITPSIGKLRKIIHCAKLEQSLYDLLLEKDKRETLANVLITEYISI